MNLFKKAFVYLDIPIFLIFLAYSLKISPLNKLAIFGYIIVLMGVLLWSIARYQLGKAFSMLPKAKKIVKNGVYNKIRHPVYIFGIIAIFGLALIYQQPWLYIGLLFLIIIQIIRAKTEENVLIAKFNEEYLEYKKNTWF